jgi:multidrug resistance efflux pump
MIARPNDIIRTPWPQRLTWYRQTALPIISFVACVLLTGWLWQRQGQMPGCIGEVEAVRIDVTASANGTLLALSPPLPALFERVEAGTVVARLDDATTRAAMATVQARIGQLRGELQAAIEKTAVAEFDRQQAQQREAARLTWEVQRHRLDVLDRRAVIETSRIEEQRLTSQITLLEPSLARGTVSELQIKQWQLQRDEVRTRIAENERALAEAQTQGETTAAALHDLPTLRSASVDVMLAPLEAAITVGERELAELQVQVDAREIRAPISGVVCNIHRWPGQTIKAGEPIITIAAEHGRYILTYVRQEQRIQPTVGMPVALRVRGSRTRPVESLVERVGPQVEQLPPHHMRDPKLPEWGQPVWIEPPPQLDLRPGELIDVTFLSQNHFGSSSTPE